MSGVCKQEDLDSSVVAEFATTASDGKTYKVDYYNLDMIISVGYRVKSQKGIAFRKWATAILKEYMIQGYAVNEKIISDSTLVAITLLLAESKPEEKEIMINVIMNFLGW
ncbi:MAG: RhuM family protein [Peptostreptococcus sp.]|uniref:RhuM family protein n=1 Tax=Peptostreptococcus TaxID=1257 RepID=UPI000792B832|nr:MULTISPECIES: RhuM family protein [Peptostreptococcus]KXB68960.1 hypothetical protein HMPREF3183_01768 [Peptostreptococcus anaerobius]MDB8850928.1 RhuM family protein [Peptostreptococcus anaerobius]MDK8277841.1 RhuM family protein [Peptostreptococcus anaerobius]MDU1264989.1 RhuM family protein [Peptostreptococcus sp.]MDU5096841.1 RhuM family protein [Peptostreptococcus anaerobius]